jgi:hypothetical protein
MVSEHMEDTVRACTWDCLSYKQLTSKNRLALNYKRLPYRVEYISYPDIESTLKKFGVPPTSEKAPQYTLPSMSNSLVYILFIHES